MLKFHTKFNIVAVILLTAILSAAAYARGGGGRGGGHGGGGAHFGGGHFGGGHIGGGRFRSAARPAFRSSRSFAVHAGARANRAALSSNRSATLGGNANARSRAVHNVLNSRAVAGALHNSAALRDPNTRAQIAARAATAGWHDGRGGRNGWWRHGNGGYGWVGPLFWPFAYDDIYDYAMWGEDPFWDYGYGDIYAGLFAPYGYDDLAGYLPPTAAGGQPAANPAPDQLAQLCGADSRDIAGLPIDRIQEALQPNDAQRSALDDLANASVKAAQDIKAACPTQIVLTAPARLASMQTRIEAMIAAVGIVEPPLQKFYDLLNDEQKARLNALGGDQQQDRRRAKTSQDGNEKGSLAQACAAVQPGVTDWPADEIEAKLRPTDAQRASLAALQQASAKAAEMLKTACQPGEAITPPARLAAAGKRLDTMLQAVKTVRTALDAFYATLSDEQKAQFEAIGPRRTVLFDAPTHFRRHHASLGGIVRRLISLAW
jgi:hypothetical protein